jgi:hypothetical protein
MSRIGLEQRFSDEFLGFEGAELRELQNQIGAIRELIERERERERGNNIDPDILNRILERLNQPNVLNQPQQGGFQFGNETQTVNLNPSPQNIRQNIRTSQPQFQNNPLIPSEKEEDIYLFYYQKERQFTKFKLSDYLAIPKFREKLHSSLFQKKYIDDINDIFNIIHPHIIDFQPQEFAKSIKGMLAIDIFFEPYLLFNVVSKAVGTERERGNIYGEGLKLLMNWLKTALIQDKEIKDIIKGIIKNLEEKYESKFLLTPEQEEGYTIAFNNEMKTLDEWNKKFTDEIDITINTNTTIKNTARSKFTESNQFKSVYNLLEQWVIDIANIAEIGNSTTIKKTLDIFYGWYTKDDTKFKKRLLADVLIGKTYELDGYYKTEKIYGKDITELEQRYKDSERNIASSETNKSIHYVNYLSFINRVKVHKIFFETPKIFDKIDDILKKSNYLNGLKLISILAFIHPSFYIYIWKIVEILKGKLGIDNTQRLVTTSIFLIGFQHILPYDPKESLDSFDHYSLCFNIMSVVVEWIFPYTTKFTNESLKQNTILKDIKFVPIAEVSTPISTFIEDKYNLNGETRTFIMDNIDPIKDTLYKQYKLKKTKDKVVFGSKSKEYELVASAVNDIYYLLQWIHNCFIETKSKLQNTMKNLIPWMQPRGNEVITDIITYHSIDKSLDPMTMTELNEQINLILKDIKAFNKIEPNIKLPELKKSSFELNNVELLGLTWIVEHQRDIFKQSNFEVPYSIEDFQKNGEINKKVREEFEGSKFFLDEKYILQKLGINNAYDKYSQIFIRTLYAVSAVKKQFQQVMKLRNGTINDLYREMVGIRSDGNIASKSFQKMMQRLLILNDYIENSEVHIYADISDNPRFMFHEEIKGMEKVIAYLPYITTQRSTSGKERNPKYLEPPLIDNKLEELQDKMNESRKK